MLWLDVHMGCKDIIWSYISYLNYMNVLPPIYKCLKVFLYLKTCAMFFENYYPLLAFPARRSDIVICLSQMKAFNSKTQPLSLTQCLIYVLWKNQIKLQQRLLFNIIQKKPFKVSHAWSKHKGRDPKSQLLTDHEPKLPFMYLE